MWHGPQQPWRDALLLLRPWSKNTSAQGTRLLLHKMEYGSQIHSMLAPMTCAQLLLTGLSHQALTEKACALESATQPSGLISCKFRLHALTVVLNTNSQQSSMITFVV